jgi:hypothetical protein
MSLILEALRKLEREKPDQARHTTVLLAPIAWPEAARGRWLRVTLGAGLIAAILAGGWLVLKGGARPATSAPSVAALIPTSTPPLSATRTVPAPVMAGRPAQASPTAKRAARHVAPAPAASSPTFRLTAIGDQDGVAVAVLNDRLVRVGDSLLGARVVGISEDQVELVNAADGRHFTLGF